MDDYLSIIRWLVACVSCADYANVEVEPQENDLCLKFKMDCVIVLLYR